MATSTYPKVRARLVELFTPAVVELEDGDKIDVTYGWPRGYTIRRAAVIVGSIADRTVVEWAALAGAHKKRDERYAISILVQSLVPGKESQQKATEHAMSINAACDRALIADDPNLNLGLTTEDLDGGQIISVSVSDVNDNDMTDTEGYGSQVEWFVEINARI